MQQKDQNRFFYQKRHNRRLKRFRRLDKVNLASIQPFSEVLIQFLPISISTISV